MPVPDDLPTVPAPAPAAVPSTFNPFGIVAETKAQSVESGRQAAEKSTENRPLIPGYRVESELGRGGMGVVFKAVQETLNRTVAIKMVLGGGDADPRALIRFLAEAEAIAAVAHPNVVHVYEFGEHHGRPYLALEYCGSGSLAGRLVAERVLTVPAAVAVVLGAARGLAAAHERGIVHRDLKPGNVLFDDAGVPKIADFGLAKRQGGGALTHTQAVMGTPAYMAPEQAKGGTKFVGPPADVHAMGVILFECLTGRLPFDADDSFGFLRKIADDEAPSLATVLPGFPRDLALIVAKCLAKDPRERYPSAAELADDLARFATGDPVSVRPMTTVDRVVKWTRRNPARAALVGLMTLLVVVLPPLFFGYEYRVERARLGREAAETARRAAEDTAAARDDFAAVLGLVELGSRRPPGWTSATLDGAAARPFDRVDDAGRFNLRSAVATALLTPDVRAEPPVTPGYTAACAVATKDGATVYLGEYKGRLRIAVRAVNGRTGEVVRDYNFVPALIPKRANLGQDGVRCLVLSPDERTIYAGTRDGELLVWDVGDASGLPKRRWQAHDVTVETLSVSPDGRSLYSSERSVLRRWDATTGQKLAERARGAKKMAVDPSAGFVFTCLDGAVCKLHPDTLADATPPIGPPGRGGGCLDLTPDGRTLVVCSNQTLFLADPATLAVTVSLIDPDLRDHSHPDTPTALAIHPGGAFAATASDSVDDRTVRVWDLAGRTLVASLPVVGTGPVGLAWADGGRTLLATAPERTERFSFRDGRVVALGPGPLVAVATDGRGVVALRGPAAASPLADRFDLDFATPGQATHSVPVTVNRSVAPGGTPGLAVAANGDVAVTTHRHLVAVVPAGPATTSRTRSVDTPGLAAYAPDGGPLWVLSDGVRLNRYDATTLAPGPWWTNKIALTFTGLTAIDSLAVGRTRVLVGRRDGEVTVLSADAKRETGYVRKGDAVTALALAADDSFAVAGGMSGLVRRIRLGDGSAEWDPMPAHAGAVTAVAYHDATAAVATGGKDRAVRLWVRRGQDLVPEFTVSGLPASPVSVAFAAGGSELVVRLAGECGVRVWDLAAVRDRTRRFAVVGK
jgi:WD40 repeat protein